MTQQKSERRIVAQAKGKPGPTRGLESRGGARATPVEQQSRQLGLRFGTAEESPRGDADAGAVRPQSRSATEAEPKPKSKERKVVAATMEEVCKRLEYAFQNVAANKGAPGPDRQSVGQVRAHWPAMRRELEAELLEGKYKPGDIRRVWIPKANGGQRPLGIPNVIDRVVQEAIRQVLEPLYEPSFHDGSHGFRPKRSCQTAIAAAKQHVEAGYEWVVDMDLENFFGTVCHQRLMARLALRVEDKRVLELIGRLLKAKVLMPDGVLVNTDEGVPQGGPLSPLLSNVVLDELDRELSRRGHRFVRYADDCNIYVQSQRAGERVMRSVTDYIERRLRLKVNQAKSAVAHPEERHFLGFRLRREPTDGSVEVHLSKRSKERLDTRLRELTPRNWGSSIEACIRQLNAYLLGWMGFFGICTQAEERILSNLDGHIRRRLRAIQLKQWKRKKTIAHRLIQMGIKRVTAWRTVYEGHRSLWALSHTPAVERALCNGHWTERGLKSLAALWRTSPHRIVAPVQLTLALG